MLGKIYDFLTRHSLIKPKTTLEKINIIKDKTFNPYSSLFYIESVVDNIDIYIKDLEFIINADIENTYPKFRMISSIDVVTIPIYKFFTRDEHIMEDYDMVLKEWLDKALKVLDLYETASKSIGLGYLYSNSNKIKPYVINIESIIDILYEEISK